MINLGLGTAQFGMDYGIVNTSGKTSLAAAKEILDYAGVSNFKYIDTASAYGDSESVIGKLLPIDHNFKIISKTVSSDPQQVDKAFKKTLGNLSCERIYGLLVHNADDILQSNAYDLIKLLNLYRDQGFVKKIGVSVYSPQQYEEISLQFKPDILQIPLNIMDQRFLQNDFLKKIANEGTDIHIRSVFLQGLLLSNLENIPNTFNSYKGYFEKIEQFCMEKNISRLQAALGFISQYDYIEAIILGSTNIKELKQQVDALECSNNYDYSHLAVTDLNLIDPRLWA